MVEVLVDSNFLIAAAQFRVDVVRDVQLILGCRAELVLVSPVLEELKAMTLRHGSSRSRDASLALELARGLRVEAVKTLSGESVDDALVRLAKDRGWIVATNDRGLRKRLDAISVPTIYFRQKSHLEIKGR